MTRRNLAWWTAALAWAEALTTPKVDVERRDQQVDAILRNSVIGRRAEAAARWVSEASADARVGSLWRSGRAAWSMLSLADRVRVLSVVAVAAGSTAALTQLAGSRDPFVWVVPLLVATLGAAGLMIARQIERRAPDERL